MSVSRFIAARLASSRQKSFTRTIIRLATAAVAISLAVMIVTVSLVRGFKHEISEKVFGFWGHINITDIRADASYEALPVYRDTALMASIADIAQVEMSTGFQGQTRLSSRGGVRHVQAVAQIPAIIKTGEQMEGIVLKGVGVDYDWKTMERFMVSGEVFDPGNNENDAVIVISQFTADRLEVAPGDRFILHFLRDDRQVQRRFTVSGIYRTGLEEYDQKFAFTPLAQVQELLGWEPDQVAGYEVFVEHVDDAGII
ncbi:MAG: ABC transporter permease, partial [Saprospiraceae bacterium]|nr:ABC transporter permease [Saprospiraceae bacterium]